MGALISKTSRMHSERQTQELGPGQYDADPSPIRPRTKGAFIAKTPRTKGVEKSQLGPGSYDVPESTLTKHRSRATYISPAPVKTPRKVSDRMGPGAYDLPERKGKSFSIGTRRTKAIEPTLGPGEYSTDDSPTKRRT